MESPHLLHPVRIKGRFRRFQGARLSPGFMTVISKSSSLSVDHSIRY